MSLMPAEVVAEVVAVMPVPVQVPVPVPVKETPLSRVLPPAMSLRRPRQPRNLPRKSPAPQWLR
jgi:hypothetical protein